MTAPFAFAAPNRASVTTNPTLSPEESDEMKRMAARVLGQGGTDQDVAQMFWDGYGFKLSNWEPPVETPSMPRGIAINALQGATLGWGDNALARIGQMLGYDLDAVRSMQQREQAQFNAENPKTALASEVAGAMLPIALTGGMAGPLVARMGIVGRAATLAATGGIEGAAYGAGTAAPQLSEQVRGALTGGIVGAVMTPTVAGAASAVGATVKPVVQKALGMMESLRTPAKTTASNFAGEKIAEALVRDHGSMDAVIRAADTKLQTGAPFTVADIGGENTLALLQAAASLRGPGKQRMVEELIGRQGDQGDRLMAELFRATRVGIDNAYDATTDLMASQRAVAAPEFQQAFTEMVSVTPELKRLLNVPQIRMAYESGRTLSALEDAARNQAPGQAGSALATPPLPTDVRVGDIVPLRGLHYVKQGLRDLSQSRGNATGIVSKQQEGPLLQLANQIRDELAGQSKTYQSAITKWGGFARAIDAVQSGKGGALIKESSDIRSVRFISKAPELIRKELDKLSPADKAFYRLGAAQDIAEMLAATTAEASNAANRLGGKVISKQSSAIRERIAALFDDPMDATAFADYVNAEARLSQTTQMLGGSRTAPLQQAMADLAGGSSASGGVLSQVAGATVKPILNRARAGWTDQISDEVANGMLKGMNGAHELQAYLNLIAPKAPTRRLSTAAGVGTTLTASRSPTAPQ